MKNLMMITGGVLMLCLLITSYTGASGTPRAAAEEEDSTSASASVPGESTAQEIFWLRAYRKKLAVFENDSETPFYVSDVYISSLPKEDRRKLTDGIRVESRKEMHRLIEDYCS